jgi:hypothetical protein
LLDWQIVNGAYGQSVPINTVPSGWSFVAIGDYTGNGTDDILFQNSNGQVGYWQISNGSFSAAVGLGSAATNWHALPG